MDMMNSLSIKTSYSKDFFNILPGQFCQCPQTNKFPVKGGIPMLGTSPTSRCNRRPWSHSKRQKLMNDWKDERLREQREKSRDR
jgi:hypothetical protein